MGAFKQILIGFELAQSAALKSFNDGVRYARIEERDPPALDHNYWVVPLRVTMGWVEDIGTDSGIVRHFDRWTEANQTCADWMGGEL